MYIYVCACVYVYIIIRYIYKYVYKIFSQLNLCFTIKKIFLTLKQLF